MKLFILFLLLLIFLIVLIHTVKLIFFVQLFSRQKVTLHNLYELPKRNKERRRVYSFFKRIFVFRKAKLAMLLWSMTGTSILVHAQMRMEVEGSIKMKASVEQQPEPGTIRWSGTDFEGWNGAAWVSLTGNKEIGSVTDIDGNSYKTIRIGDVYWMAENLKTTRLYDGTAIGYVANPGSWSVTQSKALCAYENQNDAIEEFGYLYNWYAVETNKLCPAGWSVPTTAIWDNLIDHLKVKQGRKMKLPGTEFWKEGLFEGTNESAFSAKAAGFRNDSGNFITKGEQVLWWALDPENEELGHYYSLFFASFGVNFGPLNKHSGLSVRCVKAD